MGQRVRFIIINGFVNGFVAAICLCNFLYGQSCAISAPPPKETPAQHFADFVHSTFSESGLYLTTMTPAGTTAASQALIEPKGYSSNVSGFLHHYAVSVADSVDGKFARDFVFPVVFLQNPHYAPTSANCSFGERLRHVLDHSVMTPDGKLNWSSLPASAALAGLSDLYVPRQQRTAASTVTRFATNALGLMAGDAFAEFCPDIKKKVVFLPCPSRLSFPVTPRKVLGR